jgi:alkylation response protein AidB-like acyl-CoA dehydrogenase
MATRDKTGVEPTDREASATRSNAAEVKANATALIPLLRERGSEIDRQGKLPDDVVLAMHEAGVWKMGSPVAYGGFAPMSVRETLEIITEIGKGNSSAAWAAVINIFTAQVLDFPERGVKEFFKLGHIGPFAGSSVFNLSHAEGIARKVDGGYMVKGAWSFSSNIRNAAWEVGGTTVVDDHGQEVDRIHVMIPVSQLKIADDWQVSGMKGTGSNSAYTDEEVFVPEYRTLNMSERLKQVLGEGSALQDRPIAGLASAMTSGLGAIAVGAALGALEVFVSKAKARKPWAQAYPTIAEMPSTQILVAKVRTQISLAQATLERSSEWADRISAGELDVQVKIAETDAYHEMVFCVNMLRDAIAELRNTMGSSTAVEHDLLGRFERDVRVMSLHGGMRLEWWSESYGRRLVGLPPKQGVALESDPRPLAHAPGGAPTRNVELVAK